MYRLPFRIWKRSWASLHWSAAATSTIACGIGHMQKLGQSKFLDLPKVDVKVVMRKCVNILGSNMTSIGRGFLLGWLRKHCFSILETGNGW